MAKKKSSKKSKKSSLSKLVAKAGSNQVLSNKEAMRISAKTGKDLGQIAFAANKQGIGIGANLANKLGRPGSNFVGGSYQEGAGDFIRGLQGLDLSKGQVYMGSAKQSTASRRGVNEGYIPGRTTYSPIVGLKNLGTVGGQSGKKTGKSKTDKQGKGGGQRVPGGGGDPMGDFDFDGYLNNILNKMGLGGDTGAAGETDTLATDVENIETAVPEQQGLSEADVMAMFDDMMGTQMRDPLQLASAGQPYTVDAIRAAFRRRRPRSSYRRNLRIGTGATNMGATTPLSTGLNTAAPGGITI